MGKNKKIKLNWTRIITIVVLIIVLAYGGMTVKKVTSLLSERAQLQKENKLLKEEKKKLKEELESVNKPEYIEEQAKLQLKLIRPGETLFILNGENPEEKKSDNSKDKN